MKNNLINKKKAIVFGETNLAISCIQHLLNNGWNVVAVVTRDNNVVSFCQNQAIKVFSFAESLKLPKQCYLFSIINPYVISPEILVKIKPLSTFHFF